jgi:hypothetical protein
VINYIELFSGNILNIVPELTKGCAKDEVWHILSDFIRANHSQEIIKSGYLLVLNEFETKNAKGNELYSLHLDILWQALSDENCAKIELYVRK